MFIEKRCLDMESKEDCILKCINDSIRVKQRLSEDSIKVIAQVAELIIDAYQKGNKVVWFGNGGSAADAQHLSGELVGKFYIKREPLESIALTTNTSILTAIGNDYDFSNVFSHQVKALVKSDDVVIGISTSGSSQNVIDGFKQAKTLGAITVAFIGEFKDNKLIENVDYVISVESKDTPRIQESHIMIGHIICYLVEKELFDKKINRVCKVE
jgi:D-sedoheptulose 7-phosphate isomerase